MVTETRGRASMAERSQGRCEACGAAPAAEAHHRLPRSAGGTWSPANLLHLCNRCHHRITDQRDPLTGIGRDHQDAPVTTYELGLHVPRGADPTLTPVRLVHPVYGPGWWLLGHGGQLVFHLSFLPPRRAEQLPTHKHTRVVRDA